MNLPIFAALRAVLPLLLVGAVQAQSSATPPAINPANPCNVTDPAAVNVFYRDLTTPAHTFTCLPDPGGPGTGLTVRANAVGVMAWWYCPGESKPNFGAATWARIAAGDLKPDTPLASAALTPVWCPFVQEMYAAAPKPEVWVVQKNGTTLTRPAYYVKPDKTLGAVSDQRAPVGAVCNCAIRVMNGTTTYCSYGGATVAVCVKQP
jgi:hypothetical protein